MAILDSGRAPSRSTSPHGRQLASRCLATTISASRTQSTSSAIGSVGYDAATGVLEVEFRSGGVYRYVLVPPSVHRELVGAASVGRAFRALVQDRFQVERVS